MKFIINITKAITFSTQIIEFIVTNRFISKRAFRDYRFIMIKMSLIYQSRFYEFCFDIECIISLIDRAFFDQIIKKDDLYIDIKKIFLIKIRELNIKKHNVCEYIIIFIYLFNKSGNIALIRRKIHIINNFFY